MYDNYEYYVKCKKLEKYFNEVYENFIDDIDEEYEFIIMMMHYQLEVKSFIIEYLNDGLLWKTSRERIDEIIKDNGVDLDDYDVSDEL